MMNKENLEKLFNEDLGSSYFPWLADIYFKEGDYNRAKEVCNIGLFLNPQNNDGKFILAQVAIIEDDSKTAINLLKEIIASDDLYINAMKMLVMVYQSSGKNKASMIKVIHQILDLLPGDEFASKILKKSLSKKKPIDRKTKTKRIIKKRVVSRSATKALSPKKKKISKPKKSEANIDPKMATLTFVDILIKQKQYEKANNVLNLVKKKKSISQNSIKVRIKKIVEGLQEK